MTGIDIVMQIYHMVNAPSVQALLGQGKVWQHNRPANSPYPDVVVSIPVFEGNARAIEFIDVNVHTPNLDDYYPIPGMGEDHTFPDLALHKQLVDAILPLIISGPGFSVIEAIPGTPIRDADGHWYSNIRLKFDSVESGDTHTVSLIEYNSTVNAYGGAVVAETLHWTGTASRRSVNPDENLTITNGRYEINLLCEWVLSAYDVTPHKAMRLSAPDGQYVIKGIRPDVGMWVLSCARIDDFIQTGT